MIAALALLLVQAPATATPPPRASAKAPVSAEALAFAEAYVPTEMTIRTGLDGFRKEVVREFAGQPVMLELEQRSPGAQAKLIDVTAATIEKVFREGMPGVHARVAALAAAGLSPEDLRAITRFLLSPAGQSIQQAFAANLDTSRMAEKGKTGAPFTVADMTAAIDVGASLRAISPKDIGEYARFASTPAGRRFQAMTPKLRTAITDETNKLVEVGMPAAVETMLMTMRSLAAPAEGK